MDLEYESVSHGENLVTSVQFGIISPERILAESVCKVTETTLYVRQLPKTNGLNDLRMGTSDWNMICGTCRNGIIKCVGHPGHIELSSPVYHAGFLGTLVKALRCVCFFCSELVIPVDHPKIRGARFLQSSDKARLSLVSAIGKTRHDCPHCGGPQPNYTKVGCTIKHEFDPLKLQGLCESDEERAWATAPLQPARVRSMLEHISDENVDFMGLSSKFSRPEWMVLTLLVVPPPIIRPSIKHSDDSRMRGHDDITIHLQDILKVNFKLEEAQRVELEAGENATEAAKAACETLREELQLLVAVYVHHDTRGGAIGGAANSGSGPPITNREKRLFHKRLKGKKGRIRNTLSGKRVNYCSRSVVSPDPTGDVDEVGVPLQVACTLTMPVKVTPLNLEDMRARILRGPGVLHGAANVIEPDGTMRNLELIKDRSTLDIEPGWIVDRHLQNGDIVMFNRQPSLHKMSIMGHRVRIVDGLSFRLPVCDTTAYNADFDGDEMNLHASQTLEAQVEQVELMSVTRQIISAQANKPIISLVQDSLIAAYFLTLRDTFLTRAQFMQMTMSLRYPLFDQLPPPAIVKPVALWSGKQLFSLLLPKIHMDRTVRNGAVDGVDKSANGVLDVEERRVVIVDGELLAGTLCKKTLGNTAGGVVHILVNDLGHQVAANFIGDAQRLLVDYMEYRGFSVGIEDCVSSAAVRANVKGVVDRCFERSARIVKEAADAPAHIIEGSISTMMSSMITKGSAAVQQDMDWRNNINLMVTSGAKGSPINIAQIMACVGQQSVEGARIKVGRDNRTLPSYAWGDTSPSARGFVRNSYAMGLTAQEYFFHAMGGREGLVDTAVKTAVTGYIQRRLIKALEGVMVKYDNTVRNPQGQLFQTAYGGDGMDAVYIEKQSAPTFYMNNDKVRAMVAVNPARVPWINVQELEALVAEEASVLLEDRDKMRVAHQRIGGAGTVFVPINASRVLQNAKYKFKADGRRATLVELVQARSTVLTSILASRGPEATFYILIYLRSNLTTRQLLDAVDLKLDALNWIFGQVERLFFRSLVEPGEMVGTLAASSIGEPCTQMTLNTFHTAGVENKNMTLGVPRLKEIIDASVHPKTPCVTVYLEEPYAGSEKMARTHGLSLVAVKLGQIVESSDICYDPDPWSTTVPEDAQFVSLYSALYKPDEDDGDGKDKGKEGTKEETEKSLSEWVIRLMLHRDTLVAKELTIVDVATALERYLGSGAQVVRSEVNMVNWCVRLRLRGVSEMLRHVETDSTEERIALEETATKTIHDFLMDNVPVHGILNIKRAITRKREIVRYHPTDGRVLREMEWVTETEGSNLTRLLSVAGVDRLRTISNDIHEVACVLGIEAAHTVMLDELRAVLSFDGGYVDDHHVQLLADLMTQSGSLTAVTRHGLRELGGGIWQRASFEESMEVLLDAGGHGAKNKVNGITCTVMIGQRMPAGTGICEILVRKDALPPKVTEVVVAPMDDVGSRNVVIRPMVLPSPVTAVPATIAVPVTAAVFVGRRRAGCAPSLPPGLRRVGVDVDVAARAPVSVMGKAGREGSYCPSSPVIVQKGIGKRNYRPSSPKLI